MAPSDLLIGLNPQQIEAVSAPPGPTLVVAGPGSGKTAVLTRRVAYLIRELNVFPGRIMAVTFTNKAAREMMTRIEDLLGIRTRGLTIGTFHAICARILRREGETIGVKPNYAIYDTDDQVTLIKQAIHDESLDVEKNQPRKQLAKISAAKNELISPEEYPTDNYLDRTTARIYRRYQELLRVNNALDFDDLLTQAVHLFRTVPEVRAAYQEHYHHILVDEFQDTNQAQYQLIKLLAGERANLFCVGDPDQSIYRFRGADYRNINSFLKDYPENRQILLEHNYRSHQLILDAAMSIIDKNTDRIKKDLTTNRSEGPKIALRNLPDETSEAQFIVEKVLEMRAMGKADLGDIAVMYRINAQSRALEEAFVRTGVPYRLVGGVRFYERREIKDVLAYLRAIHNPDDAISLERIVNLPARGISKQTMTKLKDWATSRHQSLFSAIQSVGRAEAEETPFNARAALALARFGAMMDAWQEARGRLSVGALLNDVLDRTGYRASLNDGTPEGQERLENVSEFAAMASDAHDMQLGEFLEYVSLVSDVDFDEKNANSVILMTLHAAKGLEFPVVFITGLEEGMLPHQMSLSDEEQMEEERRLMYVGVTRAKNWLYLTWATRRSMYGGMGERTLVSRFLTDIPTTLTSGSPVPRPSDSPLFERRLDDPRTRWPVSLPPGRARSADGGPVSRPPERYGGGFYRTGQRVLHARWGEGVIITSKIRGEDEEIDVKFDSAGFKRLFASSAHLVLLESED